MPELPPWFRDPEVQKWLWRYFISDAPKPPPPPPRFDWLFRWRALPGGGAIAVILWLIAIYAWIWALVDLFTTPKTGTPPGPVCTGSGEDRITRVADVTVFGARRSYNAAVDEAQAFCPTLASACTGSCADGSPCKPGTHLINIEQFTVASWWTGLATRTVLEYNCQCSCV